MTTPSSGLPPFPPALIKNQSGLLPLCRLVLLDQLDRDLLQVVRTIMEVTRLGCAEVAQRTWEAHHRGRAALLLENRERAELYAEQLAARGITSLVEPW